MKGLSYHGALGSLPLVAGPERLLRMMFFDNLKQTTLIALHDVKRNELIDAARFEFVVPDDVDHVGQCSDRVLPEGFSWDLRDDLNQVWGGRASGFGSPG